MLVWIPRYSYKITSGEHKSGEDINPTTPEEGAGTIAIKWSNAETDNTTNSYKKHPAFTFGTQELKGIWVGKFETGYRGATSTATAEVGTPDTNKAVIKPNAYSWRDINVSNMFTVCRQMQTAGNIYGLPTSGIDTHMMKNTEWGAVAYLTHAIGKTGKVWINPNSDYITGQAGTSVSESSTTSTIDYKSTNGVHASTTDNVYGIYDMSGGTWEYVMGVLVDGSNNPRSGYTITNNSGFNGTTTEGTYNSGIVFPESKYYDIYQQSGDGSDITNNYEINSNKTGDAMYETSSNSTSPWNQSWYSEYSYFVHSFDPWFARGGAYSSGSEGASVFAFYYYNGRADFRYGFRVVVVQ